MQRMPERWCQKEPGTQNIHHKIVHKIRKLSAELMQSCLDMSCIDREQRLVKSFDMNGNMNI